MITARVEGCTVDWVIVEVVKLSDEHSFVYSKHEDVGRVVYSTISVFITRTGAELNCNTTWLTEQKLEKLQQRMGFCDD